MKVLVVGPIYDGTGYSNAIIGYINALLSKSVEVVTRPIKMTNSWGEVSSEIKSLENKDLQNIDIVLQINLPSEFQYIAGVQNIGVFFYETSGFPFSGWHDKISLMDKIIVGSNHDKETVETETNHKNVFVCPPSINRYTDVSITGFGFPENYFTFYTIAEFNRRKNLQTTVAAYLSEFTNKDQVGLVIKTNNRLGVLHMIKEVRNGLNKPNVYPEITVIDQRLSEKQISQIHKSCDCYINTSFGESVCIPAFDSLLFGNKTIVPKSTVFLDYGVWDYMIETHPMQVTGYNCGIPGLYTSDEFWYQPTVQDTRAAMRSISKENKNNIKNPLSINNIGNKLLEIIGV